MNRQTSRFPSPTLSCPGETAPGGQTLLDTLACFMVTYFKACMLFGDCRTWSTSCGMSENTGGRRRPCTSPGFLPPGQHVFAETESEVEKQGQKNRRAKEWRIGGWFTLVLAHLSPSFLWLLITHRWLLRHRRATVLHLIRSATRTRRKNDKGTSWFNGKRKKKEPTCSIWCEQLFEVSVKDCRKFDS